MTRRQLTDGQWKLIEPFLPIGEFGPYPERLREQFEGVIWRFRTSSQWREMPGEFGPWPTVYGRFRVWRDAGVFTALLEGVIAEAAGQGQTDLSLPGVDSTPGNGRRPSATGRTHPASPATDCWCGTARSPPRTTPAAARGTGRTRLSAETARSTSTARR